MRNKTVKLRFIFALIVFGTILFSFSLVAIFFTLFHPAYLTTGASTSPPSFAPHLLVLWICLVIGIIIERFINRKIFQPINSLNQSMEEVAKGDFNLNLAQKSEIAEIREMTAHFNQMVKELSHIEVFRNDFVNSVSHEFKTPIAAIEGYATLLQSEELTDKERQEYAGIIINSTKRLTHLSDHILKLSRLENQELLLEKTNFNLAEQIRMAILTLEREWSSKEIDLDIELDEIYYNGNQDLLFQVWMNLIYNAIKFTPSGGEVKIILKQEGEKVSVQVADNGIGMTPEVRRHIFDKFYQSDKSHHSQGNGLGLPLVRRIVNLHEGIIHVDSTVGVGSIFTVILMT